MKQVTYNEYRQKCIKVMVKYHSESIRNEIMREIEPGLSSIIFPSMLHYIKEISNLTAPYNTPGRVIASVVGHSSPQRPVAGCHQSQSLGHCSLALLDPYLLLSKVIGKSDTAILG